MQIVVEFFTSADFVEESLGVVLLVRGYVKMSHDARNISHLKMGNKQYVKYFNQMLYDINTNNIMLTLKLTK